MPLILGQSRQLNNPQVCQADILPQVIQISAKDVSNDLPTLPVNQPHRRELSSRNHTQRYSGKSCSFPWQRLGGRLVVSRSGSGLGTPHHCKLHLGLHFRLGWELESGEVSANKRLLSSALWRFRYNMMSPCFSTTSSRLEIAWNPVSEVGLLG